MQYEREAAIGRLDGRQRCVTIRHRLVIVGRTRRRSALRVRIHGVRHGGRKLPLNRRRRRRPDVLAGRRASSQ